MARILLTGFGPFLNIVNNPSARLADFFAEAAVPGHELTTLTLPVAFERAPRLVQAALEAGDRDRRPFDEVVLLGVASERPYWSVERFGRNAAETHYPDADGYTPPAPIIAADMPETLPSTWPAEALVEAIERAGLPVQASDSAGDYLCNYLLFTTLCCLQRTAHPARTGFLHVPADEWTFGEKRELRFSFAQHIDAVRALLAALK